MTITRIIVIAVSAAFIIIYLYFRWRRTSKYVDDSAKAFSENQKNRMATGQNRRAEKSENTFRGKDGGQIRSETRQSVTEKGQTAVR